MVDESMLPHLNGNTLTHSMSSGEMRLISEQTTVLLARCALSVVNEQKLKKKKKIFFDTLKVSPASHITPNNQTRLEFSDKYMQVEKPVASRPYITEQNSNL